MSEWAVLDNDREVVRYRGVFDDEVRQSCVDEAIALGLATKLKGRLALAEGVEIVRIAK